MIPYGKHHIDEEDIQAVVSILRDGALTQGPVIELFEQAIANYVGAKYAVAVSSGTAALHLGAIAAGIGPGAKLVTSPITFIASANAGLYAGGDVVFADIDPLTVNMSPSHLEKVLQADPAIKVIVPVHFAGLPCEMSAIKSLADAAEAVIIEDAAHALGSTYPDGKRVGSCVNSLMTIFSFHPVKAIAAGEGGMITTNDENIYRKLLRLRSHGINKLNDEFQLAEQSTTNGEHNAWYYEMQELGFHYRITDIQCALALSQFKKLDSFIEKRREIANRYDLVFGDKNIHFQPAQLSGRSQSAHHLYVLRFDFDALGLGRNDCMKKLRNAGIVTQVHYLPVPMHPYYRNLGFNPLDYPNSVSYYQEALSIPIYFDLSNTQQDFVINELLKLKQ